jgi:RNA polymerase primary sigma factor
MSMSVKIARKNEPSHPTALQTPKRMEGGRPQRSSAIQLRTRKLLECEIDFVSNPGFYDPDAEATMLPRRDTGQPNLPGSPWLPALPPHLARLCEADLLSAEAEAELFRRMNYLKYRANMLRSQLNPAQPKLKTLRDAERFLAEALAVRDRIIRANVRLVISIVKKFARPQHPFDEMLSDGLTSLMHAVDKFDYNRGFRFSTYAYLAITRHACHTIRAGQKERFRFVPLSEETLHNTSDKRDGRWISEQKWNRLRSQTETLLEKLDRRERFILRSRFALGAHRQVRTFQCLADRLGLSKERVRQLERRAIRKLRYLAAENAPD